jgi:hypothetical protein
VDAGIQEVYFFMHQSEEVNSPELARYVIQQLNAVCGTQIKEPVFHQAEPGSEPETPDHVEKPPRKKAAPKSKTPKTAGKLRK